MKYTKLTTDFDKKYKLPVYSDADAAIDSPKKGKKTKRKAKAPNRSASKTKYVKDAQLDKGVKLPSLTKVSKAVKKNSFFDKVEAARKHLAERRSSKDKVENTNLLEFSKRKEQPETRV